MVRPWCRMALALCAGLFAVGPAYGQESPAPPEATTVPTTNPSHPMMDRRGEFSPGPRIAERIRERLGNPEAGRGAWPPPTEDERNEIANFMQTYSPERWKRFNEEVPEERKEAVFQAIRARYNLLKRMKQDEPQFHELRLKRLRIEDQVFSLAWNLKREEPRDSDDVRRRLREQLRLFVENVIDEHRLRVERVQERLGVERESLQRAERSKEEMIDRALTDIENERGDAMKDLLAPIMGGRRFGRGPASRPGTEPGDMP